MHWTILIKSHPEAPGNPVLNALRLAAAALADGIRVSLFLSEAAIELAWAEGGDANERRRVQRDLLAEILDLGAEIHTCGLSLTESKPVRPLMPGIRASTMRTLVRLMQEADQVITL